MRLVPRGVGAAVDLGRDGVPAVGLRQRRDRGQNPDADSGGGDADEAQAAEPEARSPSAPAAGRSAPAEGRPAGPAMCSRRGPIERPPAGDPGRRRRPAAWVARPARTAARRPGPAPPPAGSDQESASSHGSLPKSPPLSLMGLQRPIPAVQPGAAPRPRWPLRQWRQRGFCRLQSLRGPVGFESHLPPRPKAPLGFATGLQREVAVKFPPPTASSCPCRCGRPDARCRPPGWPGVCALEQRDARDVVTPRAPQLRAVGHERWTGAAARSHGRPSPGVRNGTVDNTDPTRIGPPIRGRSIEASPGTPAMRLPRGSIGLRPARMSTPFDVMSSAGAARAPLSIDLRI